MTATVALLVIQTLIKRFNSSVSEGLRWSLPADIDLVVSVVSNGAWDTLVAITSAGVRYEVSYVRGRFETSPFVMRPVFLEDSDVRVR